MSLACGLAALCLTVWGVERLEARAPAQKRVAWRPWYRTAIACGFYLVMGASSASGHIIGGPLLTEFGTIVGFPVLIVVQLLTRSSIRLQALEIFGVCLSFALGTIISRELGLSTDDLFARRSLQDEIFLFAVWFSILTTIAAASTCVVRGIGQMLGWGSPVSTAGEDSEQG